MPKTPPAPSALPQSQTTTSTARFDYFAVCPPGLEALAQAELFELGIKQPQAMPGGVAFSGFLTHLYRVNLWSRISSRVLLRLGTFLAEDFAQLQVACEQLPWEHFITAAQPCDVRVTCHQSRLYHSDAVAERVQRSIQRRLGGAPTSTAGTAQLVVVRLQSDVCTVSLDSSGAHLHQRGYRLQTGKAPLRENLAAALLRAVDYHGNTPFLDPCCGSGTLPIEAALIACHKAPGLDRQFAFTTWQTYQPDAWNDLLTQARAKQKITQQPIWASDRDSGAIAATQANAARAGLAAVIQAQQAPLSAAQPSAQSGCLVTNLPYGERVGDPNDLRNLYAAFGKLVKQRFAAWQVAFLAGSPALAATTGIPNLDLPLWLPHGGRPVPFYVASRPTQAT